MKLLLSSYSLEPFPLEEIFLLAKEVGADGLELILTPQVYRVGFEAIGALSREHRMPIVNVHQPPWHVLFTGQGQINKLLNVSRFFGADNLVVHLATLRRSFNSNFFEWVKAAERAAGINIAFENAAPCLLEKFPAYAGHPEELERFVRTRRVNLTLDVAKIVLAGADPYQFFQKNRDNVKAMHFHGFGNGDFHIGFRGYNFDWSGFMSFVKKFDYRGAVTLEVFPLHRWVYFNLPSPSALDRAREVIRESFALLRRA